ncbi:spore cortex biosynthesis protein YabQ [Solibacillus sp. CAU 1738]|uniref:spore cortex biosynthesis protein YabQ n=1 Tax=Solibacillus sp. CAU 1738 TaxID=3140363 RepID=UPI0032612E83
MTISAQLVSAVVMFLSGIVVGCVIDCARTIINTLPKKLWLRKITPIFEIIAWLFLGVCTFYFLYLIKGGQWRAVDPLFQLAGIFAYEMIFGRFFRFVGRVLVIIFIRPFLFIGHVVFRIVLFLFRFCVNIIKLLFTPITKLYTTFIRKRFKKQ